MDNRIKERRKALKLTQLELGKMIGVAKATVSLWENETNTPNGANLQTLASILGRSPDWILTGKVDISISTPIPEHVNWPVKAKVSLIEKKHIASLCSGEPTPHKQANAEIATALGAGPKTFAYIETSEGMMHRITPKDTVYIDPEGKLEPNSIGIFLFKAGMDYQLGTLKSTPGGLMLQFDSNEPGWNSIAVSEDDYVGRLVAYVPHWLG
jgi:transcriptional regulator with XRE-family HTH domain